MVDYEKGIETQTVCGVIGWSQGVTSRDTTIRGADANRRQQQ